MQITINNIDLNNSDYIIDSNLKPYEQLQALLREEFTYKHFDLYKGTDKDIQCFIDDYLYKLGYYLNLREDEQKLLKLNVKFEEEHNHLTEINCNIVPNNLFTACVMFGKYVPSMFIKEDCLSVTSKDYSIISCNKDKTHYYLKEVYVDSPNYKTPEQLKNMCMSDREKYYDNLPYKENVIYDVSKINIIDNIVIEDSINKAKEVIEIKGYDSIEFIKEYEECIKNPDKFSDEQLYKLLGSKSNERWNNIKSIIKDREDKIILEWNDKYPGVPFGSIELVLGKNYKVYIDGEMKIRSLHGKLWAFPPDCGNINEDDI
jgi:hypothetical protein